MRFLRALPIVLAATILLPATASPTASTSNAPNLIVSINKRLLLAREGDRTVKVFQVAVGAKKHPTPTGRFGIRHIVWNPKWVPPDEKWAKGKKPAPPGHPDNPMKVVKLFFQEPDYYIHGTDRDDSLGEAASHGCVRMSEEDVATLARWVMEHGGAARSDGWYSSVIDKGTSSDVVLPHTVPVLIAK